MHIEMNSGNCCGCTACMSVCPVDAIKMIADEEGFGVPQVDNVHCIECGSCVKVCPSIARRYSSKNEYSRMLQVYAAKYVDKIRDGSASGGLFPALAKYVLENENGYVCGCILNQETLMPEHIVSNNWVDVLRMRDSKYVQSSIGDCYCKIKTLLKQDQFILFTGTSCQVAGLYSFLDSTRVERKKLITVDFFCHGVPSPQIWKDYLSFYQKQKKRKPVGYRFRCKKYGWGSSSRGSSHLNSITYRNAIKVAREDNFSWASRMWRSIFFSNLCIRRYCHNCPYASVDKPADLTMGDFWGIEKFYPDFDDGKGSSLVLTRTKKADTVLKTASWLTIMPVMLKEVLEKQANAFKPSPSHIQREEFWQDYREKGFSFCAKKYFGYTVKNRIKLLMKRILFALKLKNIY